MKAETAIDTLGYIAMVACGMIKTPQRTPLKLIADIKTSVDEINALISEVERKENGMLVEITEPINGVSYEICGNCGDMVGSTYCQTCGTKLIWPDSEVE